MHIRRLFAASLLGVALSFCPALWAQSAPPPIPQTLEEANAQRVRATQMRDTAEKNFVVEQQSCYEKFLVNSCLDDAKKRRTAALIEARNVDIPARDFQREAKRAEVDAKEATRDADAPRRAAQEAEQAASFRAEESAKAVERERKSAEKARQVAAGRQNAAQESVKAAQRDKKIAEKNRQAAEGRQKTAADQARQQEQQAQRAKRDAERAAKKGPKTEEKP